MRKPIHYFVAQGHSMFIPLRDLYPECLVLIEPHAQAFPLQCLQRPCNAMKGCPEILAKRVHYLFTNVCPEAQQIFAYIKYRDRPNSIRAGLFDRNLADPRVIILNPYGFRKYRNEGLTYEWVPTDDYLFMGTSSGLLPASNLIR